MGLLVAPEPPEDPEPPPAEPPPDDVPPPPEELPPEPLLPVPPVASLAPLPLDSSEAPLDSLDSVAPLPVLLEVLFVEVVETEDALASFSTEVSVGGMICGVLLGTASAALEPPPQALSISAQRATAVAPTAAREARGATALTAVPCVCRRWGSR